MSLQNMIFAHYVEVNKDISIRIPTIGEIIPVEEEYYNLITVLTAMPIDVLVQLDDMGIDFSKINEYELFLIFFEGIKEQDTSLVFGDLDLSLFSVGVNEENGEFALIDQKNDRKITRREYNRIANILREIHHLEKNRRKPANEEAKAYMIQRAREKMKRHKNRKRKSNLEQLIVAMVNTEQYKYDFEGTKELSIYQFNRCVKQIVKKVDYDNKMYGVYTGTISTKDLSRDDLNWLYDKI